MKVALVMVSSLNGKITRGDDPSVTHWSSEEDQKLFAALIAKARLILMGRQTYEAGRERIKLQPGKLRIVLTRQPERFRDQAVTNQLEFTKEKPKELIKRLEAQGYKELLLVGGGKVNVMFLKEHLVSEIHLTIEPLLFGYGTPLVAEGLFDVPLQLVKIKRLNKNGTLHLTYKVKDNLRE